MIHLFFFILLATLPAVPSKAAEQAEPSRPLHWFEQYSRDAQAAWGKPGKNTGGAVRFVFGNNIWQPGRQFKNGSNWLALVCNEKACSFEPASLKVSDKAWQGHYDDQPTSGQHLLFKQSGASGSKVIAWFESATALPWLRLGAIPSYYTGADKTARPSGKGTLEIAIVLPSGETAKLVPMLLTAEQAAKLSNQHTPQYPRNWGSFLLQLRAKGKRQLLLGELGVCGHAIDRGYLLWAGDMDRDGKTDYLINFIDQDGPVHLYLSSLAGAGQLVGLAGIHLAPPFGGECDGSGWL